MNNKTDDVINSIDPDMSLCEICKQWYKGEPISFIGKLVCFNCFDKIHKMSNANLRINACKGCRRVKHSLDGCIDCMINRRSVKLGGYSHKVFKQYIEEMMVDE